MHCIQSKVLKSALCNSNHKILDRLEICSKKCIVYGVFVKKKNFQFG